MSITIVHQSPDKYIDKQELREGLKDLFGLLPESFDYGQFIEVLNEACQEWSGDTIEDIVKNG